MKQLFINIFIYLKKQDYEKDFFYGSIDDAMCD